MQELMEALRNYGSFNILSDIIKQGYAKREKGTERAKTVAIMLDNGLTELDDYLFLDIAEEAKSKMNTSKARLSAFMTAKIKK